MKEQYNERFNVVLRRDLLEQGNVPNFSQI